MKTAPLPAKVKSHITEGLTPEQHISYQVTIVANLMAFGSSTQNMMRFGINYREWRVLNSLVRLGPQTGRQLVDITHQNKATISRAIAELSQKDLITKLPNKLHKRSPLIWITEEGKALNDRIMPSFDHQAKLFTDVLSTSEKNQLCNILDRLKEHIEYVREFEELD